MYLYTSELEEKKVSPESVNKVTTKHSPLPVPSHVWDDQEGWPCLPVVAVLGADQHTAQPEVGQEDLVDLGDRQGGRTCQNTSKS